MARSKSKQKRKRHIRWLKYKRRMEKKQKLASSEAVKPNKAQVEENK